MNHRETKLSAILSGTEENGSIIDAFLTPDATTSLNSSPRMGIMFYQFHFDAAAWSVRVEDDEEKVTVVNPLLQTFFEVEHNKERKFLYNDHIFVEPLGVTKFERLLSLFNLKRDAKHADSKVQVQELVEFLTHFNKWDTSTCKGFDTFIRENHLDSKAIFGEKQVLDLAEARRILSVWIISQSGVGISLWEGNHRGYPLKNFCEGFYNFSDSLPLCLETNIEKRKKYNTQLNGEINPIHRKTFVTVGVCSDELNSVPSEAFKRFRYEGHQIQKSADNTVKGGWSDIMKRMCLEIRSDNRYESIEYDNYMGYEGRKKVGHSIADKLMSSLAKIFCDKATAAMAEDYSTVKAIFSKTAPSAKTISTIMHNHIESGQGAYGDQGRALIRGARIIKWVGWTDMSEIVVEAIVNIIRKH